MPDVSVHVKGSQSVTKPVNEARDSIHNLKTKVQETVQPLKDLTGAFTAFAGLGGAVIITRQLYQGLASCESAFEKLHPEITKTSGSVAHWKQTMEESKASLGGVINTVLSPMRTVLTDILDRFNKNAAAALDFGDNVEAGAKKAGDALQAYYERQAQLIADPRFQGIVSGLPPVTPLSNISAASLLPGVLGGTAFGGTTPTPFEPIDMHGVYDAIVRVWEHALEKQIQIDKATITAAEVTVGEPIFPSLPVDFTQPGFNMDWATMAPSGLPEQTMQPGSLGPDTQSFDMLGAAFGNLTSATGLLTSIFNSAGQHIASFGRLMNIVDDVMGVMFEILEPAINSILNPILDVLKTVFYVIGQFLLPMYELLGPAIKMACDGLIWFYNNVIVPVGNFFLNIIWYIVDFAIWIIATVRAWLNFQAGPLFEKSVIWGAHRGLQPMEYKPNGGYAPAGGWPGEEGDTTTPGTTYTGVTTVQQPPDIYITININGNVLGEGGKATLGAEVVEAISAYLGTGAHVAFLNN